METVEKTVKKLRGMEKRITPQLLEVLKFMEGNTSHPSAGNVYENIKEIFPTLSLNTVYNILKMLSETGQIQEIFIDKERSKYDPNIAFHHHIICGKCKTIDDIFIDLVDIAKLPKGITTRYDITGYHVDLYGYCKGCKYKGSKIPTTLSSPSKGDGKGKKKG
ncbi:MAG: Fur family transcriptional regulator [Candidatus Brocadiales bacterium]